MGHPRTPSMLAALSENRWALWCRGCGDGKQQDGLKYADGGQRDNGTAPARGRPADGGPGGVLIDSPIKQESNRLGSQGDRT